DVSAAVAQDPQRVDRRRDRVAKRGERAASERILVRAAVALREVDVAPAGEDAPDQLVAANAASGADDRPDVPVAELAPGPRRHGQPGAVRVHVARLDRVDGGAV